MADFLIVHGGWGGGWEWTPVARKLRDRGHEVYTPTLTGLGERAHLEADIGLSTHIEDVLAVLAFEGLRDVVLCGHSYGGMVVTGAADRAAERIRRLVYLDAFVPRDGQAVTDLVPSEFAEALLGAARERRDGRVPIPAELLPHQGVMAEEGRARYVERLRPHPIATMTEPVRLSGAIEELPRAFVHCVDPADEIMATFAARARSEGWVYRELVTAHDLQLLDPDGTTAILDELGAP